MRLNKLTCDAIAILVACSSSHPELQRVATISDGLGLTRQNATKIAYLLCRAGFLSAVRGRNGGVRLARPAIDINVGSVVAAFESLSGGAGTEGRSSLDAIGITVFDEAVTAFISVPNQNTIADLAAQSRTRRCRQSPVRTEFTEALL